jgi:hypothetical protein
MGRPAVKCTDGLLVLSRDMQGHDDASVWCQATGNLVPIAIPMSPQPVRANPVGPQVGGNCSRPGPG